VRQSLALGSFILFRLENAQRIYFFHSPSWQKDEKKNIQWHFSNSSAKLNHANWSQREQWQLLIPMLPVYPFQFLMRSTSRSPKKSVPNHDPTLGINIKNHDQLLYFFGGGCIQSSQGKYGNNILSKPVQTIQVLPESRPIQLHAAKKPSLSCTEESIQQQLQDGALEDAYWELRKLQQFVSHAFS
jgi:hypothetical protein